jgi:DNA mismatch repair ATPase MutS
MINTPISVGELFDKLTILTIKLDTITDPEKLKNITVEHNALLKIASDFMITSGRDDELLELSKQLKEVNQKIWNIEDQIRACEKIRSFKHRFIELARGVYLNNDERARIKKEINTLCSSQIIEEKSYTEYKT